MGWIWSSSSPPCAVIRLARFNVEQAGTQEDALPRAPQPGGGHDAGHVLLVQPDAAVHADASRPAVARDAALRDARARPADDQPRDLPRPADDQLPQLQRASPGSSCSWPILGLDLPAVPLLLPRSAGIRARTAPEVRSCSASWTAFPLPTRFSTRTRTTKTSYIPFRSAASDRGWRRAGAAGASRGDTNGQPPVAAVANDQATGGERRVQLRGFHHMSRIPSPSTSFRAAGSSIRRAKPWPMPCTPSASTASAMSGSDASRAARRRGRQRRGRVNGASTCAGSCWPIRSPRTSTSHR